MIEGLKSTISNCRNFGLSDLLKRLNQCITLFEFFHMFVSVSVIRTISDETLSRIFLLTLPKSCFDGLISRHFGLFWKPGL